MMTLLELAKKATEINEIDPSCYGELPNDITEFLDDTNEYATQAIVDGQEILKDFVPEQYRHAFYLNIAAGCIHAMSHRYLQAGYIDTAIFLGKCLLNNDVMELVAYAIKLGVGMSTKEELR